MDDIERSVELLILNKWGRSGVGAPVIKLGEDEYWELFESIEPKYKKTYGAPIVSSHWLNMGYESVIFKGAAVVLDPENAEWKKGEDISRSELAEKTLRTSKP